jgi:hypothetical protein
VPDCACTWSTADRALGWLSLPAQVVGGIDHDHEALRNDMHCLFYRLGIGAPSAVA